MENDVLSILFADHLNMLVSAADVVGHSIDSALWSRIHAMLSPMSKYDVRDPLWMSTMMVPKITMSVDKHVIFVGSGKIKIYLSYEFPEYDGAAISLFLSCKGAPQKFPETFTLPGVSHALSIGVENSGKIHGIVAVQKTQNADIYSKLLEVLEPKINNTTNIMES